MNRPDDPIRGLPADPREDFPATATWRRADDSGGHSLARVERSATGWRSYGCEVATSPDGPLACWFWIETDRGWATRSVKVRAVDRDGVHRLRLGADDDRRWTLNGRPAAHLDGCVDVDVAATPLTNTYPIRRLQHLDIGESSTSAVAWVEVPSLRVRRVEQTYLRLAERRWRYSDPLHGGFELEVDHRGLVASYAGFAERVDG